MRTRANTLCAILIALLLSSYAWRTLTPPPPLPAQWLSIPLDADAETVLAAGGQIPLACADIAQLELISGISDTLAAQILADRASVVAAAPEQGTEAALSLVHGIGPAKAAQIARHVSLADGCFVAP